MTNLPTPASKGTPEDPGLAGAPRPGSLVPHRTRKRNPATAAAEHSGQFALTLSEVQILLEAVTDVRDSALLTLAIGSGIRREDLVAVKLADFEPERSVLRFYESKKRKVRTVILDPKATVALQRWLGYRGRESQWIFPSDYRFSNPRGHLSGRAAYNILQRWLAHVGLPGRPFHSLRATCYKLAKARGWSIELAAAQLGDTVRVAQEFYGVATPGEISQAMKDRPLL